MGSFVLRTISVTYLLLVLTCTVSLLTHDEECLALFEFKQNHDGVVFQKFDSWRKIKSNNGHVIGLDLSGSSLHGLINSNSALFKLVHLQMYSTGFTGILPESMGHLNRLKVLALRKCYFSGPIPVSLSNLTQLTFLSLNKNEFSGLVPSLASLMELRNLRLGDNNFEMGGVYDWINKLTKLVQLSLYSMNIHGEILPYLANLTKLSYVSMEENFISGRIPSLFMNLTQLTSLDLQGNQLQGQISRSFLNFKSLKYLAISRNNFSGTVGLDSFLGLNKLELLGLDYNRLSFVTSTNYTNETLPELKRLGLSSCNLKEFPAFLRFQMKIATLYLEENEIEGLVPNWIWNNSQETLRTLLLRGNFITGFHEHPSFLPWIRLEEFDMAYNQLQGLLPIPPQTIVFYDVSNNNLTGEIPVMLCEVKSLQFLDLSSNKMTGTLPPCLGKLMNSLLVLDLKRNNFHGPMMHIYTHGRLLKLIDLSENQLTGQVLRSLANCTNLEFISLADNSFKDVFPLWLGTLPKLQVLILRSNKFYGAIQGLSTISLQFLKLRVIDVSNNHFSGQLPDKSFQTWNAMKSVFDGESSAMELQIPFHRMGSYDFPYSMTLTNKGVKREYHKILNIFTAIDLSCNNFEGQIPRSLQDLRGLESLNLSNNHFTGHILPSLSNLKNLESLDLSRNELSGKIPQQLLQLGFLAILNVSFNHLDGHILQGKQFDTFENNSYMGNPGLCGKPLSKECENSKVSTVLPPTSNNEYEPLLPSDRIDWMVVSLGVGSGLIIGIVFGSNLITRKNKRVRPRRNTRRN